MVRDMLEVDLVMYLAMYSVTYSVEAGAAEVQLAGPIFAMTYN